MATALIRQVIDHHAGAEVTLITTPPFAQLFASWDDLRVVSFERRGFRAALGTIQFLRAGGFNRVYDFQSNDRTAIYLALSGIPERVGNHPRFPYNIHPTDAWRGDRHIFDRMNAVLHAAGVGAARPRPVLPVSAQQTTAVVEWLAQRNIEPDNFVVMHAGASPRRPEKRWPHFGDLAEYLAERGLETVWVGGPADVALNRSLATRTGHDATNQFSIPQLAELARHARCAVTNDSGPMHAMAAADIPVYALFGPSDPRRNHALGQKSNVIPASEINAISVSMVINRVTGFPKEGD